MYCAFSSFQIAGIILKLEGFVVNKFDCAKWNIILSLLILLLSVAWHRYNILRQARSNYGTYYLSVVCDFSTKSFFKICKMSYSAFFGKSVGIELYGRHWLILLGIAVKKALDIVKTLCYFFKARWSFINASWWSTAGVDNKVWLHYDSQTEYHFF